MLHPNATDMRERRDRRMTGLAAVRKPWEPVWRDTAELISPVRSPFLWETSSQGKDPNIGNTKLLDRHGTWAWRVMTAGMTSGLTSASRPWFKLEAEDSDLMDDHDVKVWFSEVQKRMYSALARSNYYAAVRAGYGEMGMFGQEGCLMEQGRTGIVNFPMQQGEFWIGLSSELAPDTLYRRCEMTVIQLYQRFVKQRYGDTSFLPQGIKDAYDKGDYGAIHDVRHSIEPNYDAQPGKADRHNMPFSSCYWLNSCKETGKEFLEVGGYREQPFWAPRWDPVGSATYSSCPGSDALGDLRELQMTKLRKGQARDFVVKPALRAPYALQNAQKALLPGGVSYMSAVDKDAFGPLWVVDPRVIGLLTAEQQELHQAVDLMMYVDTFLAITNAEGSSYKNIEEVQALKDEQVTQLGPVVERALGEKLTVGVDRCYNIMNRAGQLPPPPEALHGAPIKVVFVSILAQLQRAQGIRQIERFVGFAGNVGAVQPQAFDKVNWDKTMDLYGDAVGVDPTMINSDQFVQKVREARAKQEAAAQAAATAQPAAAAAKDGAAAAELLSRTRVDPNGETMLSRVFG
jgi:hypothetical protein